MKSLNKYIKDNKSSLISLKDDKSSLISLSEKLIINKNYNPYMCTPKSFKELRKIIKQRYKEQGPGTEKKPIDFNDIDVSNVDSFCNENMNIGIFEGTEFEYIDISDWDVSNVNVMSNMFNNCYNLKSVGDLSNWDVSKVENMAGMFSNCYKLKSIGNLSNWKVSNVVNMNLMFYGCKILKSVGDLSNWNVSNVENMNIMFKYSGITNIPDWYKE